MPPSPLQRARDRLAHCASIYPYFLISASGGKDSNASFPLLAELRAKDPRIKIGAYHYTLMRGIQCVERPIETLCRRYQVPVHYLIHPSLPQLLYEGFCRTRTAIVGRAYQTQLNMVDVELAGRLWFACLLSKKDASDLVPAEDEEEAKLSLRDLSVDPFKVWYVGGQRQNDSLERRAMLSGFRRQQKALGEDGLKIPTGGQLGVNPKERRVYPLADWSSDQVLAYCRAMNLPAAADLGGKNTKGVNPSDPAAMRAMRDNYPRDFARLAERFPLAIAVAEG